MASAPIRPLPVPLASGLIAAALAATVHAQIPPAPSFTKDVLPLLQRSCQQCHRPGTSAPMSLLTYEDVRPWARTIRVKVSKREMPPWHIDRSIGEYLDDPSLSDDEIATIVRWIDTGLPRGNPVSAPFQRTFADTDEWTYGKPDLVVEMKNGFTITPNGPDTLPEESVDPKITEDRYVKWVQIIPSAKRAVHHSHVYVEPPDGSAAQRVGLGMGSNRADEIDLIEYGTGNDADIFPDGTSKMIPAGSMFRFSSHYHPYGEEVHDRQKVGIKFYPIGVVPKYVVTSHRIRTGGGNDWTLNREAVEDLLLRAGYPLEIDEPFMPTGALIDENPLHSAELLSIPPNTIAQHDRYWPLPKPALIISFQPHMHFRGTRMTLEAIHRDGRRELLTDATHYEQNWQITYKYKVPHLFPAGTILHTTSWHDNTTNNRHNPDPTGWVGWGSRTMDEMGQGWTDIAFLTEEQYEHELGLRASARKTNIVSNQQ